MPTRHPLRRNVIASTPRVVTTVGLAVAAAATALALPSTGHAAPNAEQQLADANDDYRDATDTLDELRDDRDSTAQTLADARDLVDSMPDDLPDVTEVTDQAHTIVDRFSKLADYRTERVEAWGAAVDTVSTAERQLESLDDRIDRQRDTVAELADTVASLTDTVEAQADDPTGSDGGDPGITDATGSGDGSAAVAYAEQQLGDPYAFGAAGPDSFDCSGLTQAAWASAGVSIGRDTYAQWSGVTHVSGDGLQPGDLVFYSGQSHVALYVGDGRVIHAPTEGDVVSYADVDMMPIDGYARP